MNAYSSLPPSTQPLVATAMAPAPHGKSKALPDQAASFTKHLQGDRQPPSQAARAALSDRPDLASKPFGQIVSLIARHQDLPPAESAAEEPEAPAEGLPADVAPTG